MPCHFYTIPHAVFRVISEAYQVLSSSIRHLVLLFDGSGGFVGYYPSVAWTYFSTALVHVCVWRGRMNADGTDGAVCVEKVQLV